MQFQYHGVGSTACTPRARPVTQIAVTGITAQAGVLTVNPAEVKRISGTRLAFRVPSTAYPGGGINPTGLVVAGDQTSARWNVCVYDNDSPTTGILIAASTYTVVARPTIISILPQSSPAAGGQNITVNGTGFTTAGGPLTAAIGGTAMTNVKVAASGTSFTATTAPRAPGAGLELTVTTPGGTVGSLNPDNDVNIADTPLPFEYSNGITISPTSSPVGKTVTVDIRGVGFEQLTFVPGGVPTDANAHIFLVNGAYVAASNRGVAECKNAVVLSDTELVCTLDLSADRLNPADSTPVQGSPIPDGAYVLTVVDDGTPGAGLNAKPSIISSGAVFVVAPY